MPEQRMHGIEVIRIDDGVRPIETVKSSVIGLVGTAPDANEEKFPLNTPVLIASQRTEIAGLGKTGTLPMAVDGIFDQCGAMMVIVRVEESNSKEETISNIIGGVDDQNGQRLGLQALLDARSQVKVQPRIIIAPGFSHEMAVGTEMVIVAERLKGIAIADGPGTTDESAISYRENYGTNRMYIVDPWVKVWDTTTSKTVVEPVSARVAGLLAKSDNERGFWWSPSNQEIRGIVGTARGIDFSIGDVNCRANFLNSSEVTTIIHDDGYRLWGNRTCSQDPKWAFINVSRTADMIEESLQEAHRWAVDRNITKTYVEDVREGVLRYMRHLTKVGAILGGNCWVERELNSKDQLVQGIIQWSFDFTPPPPAEHLVFRSHLVDTYLENIFI